MHTVKPGDIIVTDMTDPDWEPIMKIAGGIITNRGGRTCHAAIISRELGIPAIVGTKNGTETIPHNTKITLDCTSGEVGYVYDGEVPFTVEKIEFTKLGKPPVDLLMNIGNPDEAFNLAKLPNSGVGLARLEFIINNSIQVHPMALIHPERVTDKEMMQRIDTLTRGYTDKKQFFIDKLAQETATIAAAFYPKPVIIRMSDFKSNEYRELVGGIFFEPIEENPMIGFRGASRYYHPNYAEAFALECAAMKRMRDDMGLTNAKLMIPFVRTVDEAKKVIAILEQNGLRRGENEFELYMMCEIPSNVLLINEFAKLFDGFSIGSNDLTQMTLAVDRDSALVAPIFDERNEAVKIILRMAIDGAKKAGKKIGICGQAPSDYPEIAQFLVEAGIDSLSLNSDTITKMYATLGK
jgi:pyruvate,water dikinase